MKGLKTKGRIEYWNYASPIIISAHKDTGYFLHHSFSDDVWMFGERIGGFKFSCAANKDKSRVELDLSAPRNPEINRSAFDYLYERKEEIELIFGDELHWDRDYSSNSSFITHWNTKLLITNREDWAELANYHAHMSRRLYEVMTPFLRNWNRKRGTIITDFVPISRLAEKYSLGPDVVTEEKIKAISDESLHLIAELHSVEKPEITESIRQEFRRDPAITAYAKRRARGICQLCGEPAPFFTPSGEPYLEVHHIEWLMNGGSDSLDNTVALCPNCHRRMHSLNLPEDVEKLKEAIRR